MVKWLFNKSVNTCGTSLSLPPPHSCIKQNYIFTKSISHLESLLLHIRSFANICPSAPCPHRSTCCSLSCVIIYLARYVGGGSLFSLITGTGAAAAAGDCGEREHRWCLIAIKQNRETGIMNCDCDSMSWAGWMDLGFGRNELSCTASLQSQ